MNHAYRADILLFHYYKSLYDRKRSLQECAANQNRWWIRLNHGNISIDWTWILHWPKHNRQTKPPTDSFFCFRSRIFANFFILLFDTFASIASNRLFLAWIFFASPPWPFSFLTILWNEKSRLDVKCITIIAWPQVLGTTTLPRLPHGFLPHTGNHLSTSRDGTLP